MEEKRRGRPRRYPRDYVQVNFRVSPIQRAHLHKAAERNGMTLVEYVNHALAWWFTEGGGKEDIK